MRPNTSPLSQLGASPPSSVSPLAPSPIRRRSSGSTTPRPLSTLTPWLDALLALGAGLADAHRSGWTAHGRFTIGEGPRPSLAPDQSNGQGARADFTALVTQAERWITDRASRGPLDASERVLAEALVDAGDADDVAGWVQRLMTALIDRATRSRGRLEGEQSGIEGRQSALLVQRRLRARLAQRITRIDASMGALERSLLLDERRVPTLHAAVRTLDELREASLSVDESPFAAAS